MTKNKRKTWQKKYKKHDESRCDLHVATFRWLRVSRTGKYGTWESRGLSKYTRQHTTSRFPLRSNWVFSKFPEILFQIGNSIWQSVSIWQRDEKRVMKREKALCITFQNGFSHFNLWTSSSSSRDVRRKKSLPLHGSWRCRFKKAPWFLNLWRFWRLVFPTD